MPRFTLGRERDRGGDLPPEVNWPNGFDLSGTPNRGLVTNLNSPWMEIKPGFPIPITADTRRVFAYQYGEDGVARTSGRFQSDRGVHIADERGFDATGLDLEWALRDWRRGLLLGSSIAEMDNSQLTEEGIREAVFLRRHVRLLVPDPEAMIVTYPHQEQGRSG